MNLPTFSPGDDPGPDFARLVRNSGLSAPVPSGDATLAVPHGTTCLAVRFADGKRDELFPSKASEALGQQGFVVAFEAEH